MNFCPLLYTTTMSKYMTAQTAAYDVYFNESVVPATHAYVQQVNVLVWMSGVACQMKVDNMSSFMERQKYKKKNMGNCHH